MQSLKNITVEGIVIQDEKQTVEFKGKSEVKRIALLFQGAETNLKMNLPLNYKREKPDLLGKEKFVGDFFFGSINGRDFATLKVYENK
jgi:hypothetical protein